LLNEHEVLTLARYYGQRLYPILTTLMWVIQDTLQQINYLGFPALRAALAAEDQGDGGFLSRDIIRHICRKEELPLPDQLVDGAIMK
jgi:hypothetical protein